MSEWTIYGKDGDEKRCSVTGYNGDGEVVRADSLEYSGSWMGECFLTVTVKSPYPVDFQIGDYIEYRGERFTINYDPTVIKKARRGTYGEGFVYDGIKFNSYSDELTLVSFHDRVLSDSELHYTSMPDFAFYCKDVDDLADRLQANTDRWCKDNGRAKDEYWMFYTLSNNTEGTDDEGQSQTTYERTLQRANDVLESCGLSLTGTEGKDFLSSVQSEWEARYNAGDSRDDERYDRNISVSGQTVWDALSLVKTDFGLNFIVRGRNVYIGTAGVYADHMFAYGKGNGLYEIDRTADSSQKIVTKLHAYGSADNLPTRYYATLNKEPGCLAKSVRTWTDDPATYLEIVTDLLFEETYFRTLENTGLDGVDQGYKVSVKCSSVSVSGYIREDSDGYCVFTAASGLTAEEADIKTLYYEVENAIKGDENTAIVYFTSGVRKAVIPESYLYYTADNGMPDNLAVNSLMLPGFPVYALSDICSAEYDDANDVTNYYITNKFVDGDKALFHTEKGKHVVTFSSDPYDPYILSPNAAELGIREGDISCTEENDDNGLEKVYPTIEEMTSTDAGLDSEGTRLDEVLSADTVADNGVFPVDKSESNVPGFKMRLPKLGFDLKQAAEDAGGSDMKISMKDGFCGGREFGVASVEELDDGTWELDCRRSKDDGLDLWFPYSYAASVKSVSEGMTDAYQIVAGDRYVLTGIYVDDVNYVWAASVKLLRKAVHWLIDNDYTRYVYSPKIDEIYMARQAEEAESDGAESLHDILKEGDLLMFSDSDLSFSGTVYIEKLIIKEYGNNGIPTYDVTLRDEVQVGTLQRIQNKVDSIANDIRSGAVTAGLTGAATEPLIKAYGQKYFLSKLTSDIASGVITFAKGLVSEAEATFEAAVNIVKNLVVGGNASVEGELTVGANTLPYGQGTQGFKVEVSKAGARVQTDYLDVTKKLTAHEVTIQKVEHIGGKQISTAARMICSKVAKAPAGTTSVTYAYKGLYSDAGTVVFLTEEPADADGVTTAELSNAVEAAEGKMCVDITTGGIYVYGVTGQDSGGDDMYGWVATEESEWTDVVYACFFEKTDSDGRAVNNLFEADDLAYCQTFNLSKGTTSDFSNSYYWRKVTATGGDFIILSDYKQDPDSSDIAYDSDGVMLDGKVYGSTEPQAGDEIVLLGNISDTTRQGAIIQASADTWTNGAVPYFSIYTGIKSFSLPKARHNLSPGSNWIEGEDVTISTSSGEVSLTEYVTNLSNGLDDVSKQVDESFMIYQSDDPYVQEDGSYVPPTLDSEPASEWTTDEEKAEHVGDFYLSSDGFCWKFKLVDDSYTWDLVVDKYLTAYVKEIGEKRRVFISQPGTDAAYDVGDLWVNASYHVYDESGNIVIEEREYDGITYSVDYDQDTLVCIEAKKSGEEFSIYHWMPASGVNSHKLSSGFMTKTDAEGTFASLYSQYEENGDIVSKATMTTAITNGISTASIKAEQVEILSDHFSVKDGDVYAHSLTLTGAFNNMRTVVTKLIEDDSEITETVVVNNAPSTYTSSMCFDLLTSGSIIILQLGGNDYKIALPFCYGGTNGTAEGQTYLRTLTKFDTSSESTDTSSGSTDTSSESTDKVSYHNITIAEMRMLVGKKLYVYNGGTQSQAILFGRGVASESDGVVVFESEGWVEDSILPKQYRIYECKLGCENLGTSDNSAYYECIYWKPVGNVGVPLTEFSDEEA